MPVVDHRQAALRLVATLSYQEKQILAGLANGRSIRSIASSLSIAAHEADQARHMLMEKLSARTTADAVRIGIYASLPWPD